jgi:sodium/hydrogen antiporter
VIAMLGSYARRATLGFVGWFGPRGLASIVFAVIVVEESNLPHETLIV